MKSDEQIIASLRNLTPAIIITPRKDGYIWQCLDRSGQVATLNVATCQALHAWSDINALEELTEQLAALEHASWSHWMRYLFSICDMAPDGSACIPSTLVQRWKLQSDTPYEALTENEKQSDRNRVHLILPLIEEYVKAGRE